jgi:hypothetical protein
MNRTEQDIHNLNESINILWGHIEAIEKYLKIEVEHEHKPATSGTIVYTVKKVRK